MIASVGMPGLGNFVGEFLALLGAFQENWVMAVIATAGIVVAAVYGLYLMQRSFQGTPNPDIVKSMRDFGLARDERHGGDDGGPRLGGRLSPACARTVERDDPDVGCPAVSAAEVWALAPYLALAGGIALLLVAVAALRSHRLAFWGAIATLAIPLAFVPTALGGGTQIVDTVLEIDGYALFFFVLFSLAAITTAVLSARYLGSRASHRQEFYLLLTTATLGAAVTAGASHFATFLMGLEVLSISLYAMIAYPEEGHPPLEAAAKYLVLSGAASSTMLFGMALIYAASGSLTFEAAVGDLAAGEHNVLGSRSSHAAGGRLLQALPGAVPHVDAGRLPRARRRRSRASSPRSPRGRWSRCCCATPSTPISARLARRGHRGRGHRRAFDGRRQHPGPAADPT